MRKNFNLEFKNNGRIKSREKNGLIALKSIRIEPKSGDEVEINERF